MREINFYGSKNNVTRLKLVPRQLHERGEVDREMEIKIYLSLAEMANIGVGVENVDFLVPGRRRGCVITGYLVEKHDGAKERQSFQSLHAASLN